MRVRSGRFRKLRSTETGYTQPVRPCRIQNRVQEHPAVAPPAAGVGRHLCSNIRASSHSQQFPINSVAASRLRPPARRVSFRTRCPNAAIGLLATRRWILPPGATQKLQPRNLRWNRLATALLVGLTVRRSLPYSPGSRAITRLPARRLRTKRTSDAVPFASSCLRTLLPVRPFVGRLCT